jgi:hypothetical protein
MSKINDRELASKKGIIITVTILAAIFAASFLVWLIPLNVETNFVISDFGNHLDKAKEIHLTLQTGIDQEFQNMLDEEITPEEYIELAEISSSQVNSIIIQLVESKAPEEWYESYLSYIEALKKFNSEIRETIVIAKMISDDKLDESNDIFEKIKNLRKDSQTLASISEEAKP